MIHVLVVLCTMLVGAVATGCSSSKCTGLRSYDLVHNDQGLPWTGSTSQGRCVGADVCVMDDGLPTCAPFWLVIGRSPWFLGTLALALVIGAMVVIRKRRAAARPEPKDDWRTPRSS